jgi:lysine 6-dehydrogenase
MAEAVLHDFVQFQTFDAVTLADADLAGAEDLARRRGGGVTRAVQLDAADEAAARTLVAGHDVCVSAAPFRFNLALARAAVAAGAHFTDMGGNNDVVAAELALDGEARAAGVTVVPDMGLAPGLATVLAAGLLARLDETRELHLRVGGLPCKPKPPLNYALVFSPYGLINEYAEPCLILRGGELLRIPALSEVEELAWPPFGALEAFHTSGGASTLPHTLRGRVRELDYKTLRYAGHAAQFKLLLDLGFASQEAVRIGEARVTPRDVLCERLVATLPEGTDDVVLVRCWAAGVKDGREVRVTFELEEYADAASGLTAMMRLTGFPVAVAAATLAQGEATRAGALPVEEAFAPAPFLAAMRARGVTINET